MLKHHIVITYCIVSVLSALCCLCMFVWQDFKAYRRPELRDPKFGYNYENPLTYITVLACLPGLNLIAVVVILGSWCGELVDRIKH